MPPAQVPTAVRLTAALVVVLLPWVATACSDEDAADDPATTTASTTSAVEDPEDDATSTTTRGNTTTTVAGTDPGAPECAALREVMDLQVELNQEIAGVDDWTAVQATFEEFRPRIESAYAQAAEEVPRLESQIQQVADLTDEGLDVLLDAPDQNAAQQTLSTLPSLESGQTAAEEIDAFTTSTCGFAFSQ